MTLKARITDDMKIAMKARDAERLATIRLLLAAMKQKEVDERIELSDADIIAVIDKMLKHRRDSGSQYDAATRHDLADRALHFLRQPIVGLGRHLVGVDRWQ